MGFDDMSRMEPPETAAKVREARLDGSTLDGHILFYARINTLLDTLFCIHLEVVRFACDPHGLGVDQGTRSGQSTRDKRTVVRGWAGGLTTAAKPGRGWAGDVDGWVTGSSCRCASGVCAKQYMLKE